MSLIEAKEEFLKIIRKLEASQKRDLLLWISKNWAIQLKEFKETEERAIATLEDIADDLRRLVPLNGVLPSEKIYESHCVNKLDKATTIHVDEFIFPDDVVDKMEEEGTITRHYCSKCGCKDLVTLDFITHSLSIQGMRYVFSSLLPPLDGKVILDVGSRLGAILFGAYYFTTAKKIIGVEISGEWCTIVKKIVNTRNLQDRIDVVHSDIREQSEQVSSADVLIVNNVFEYFADKKEAEDCWKFMIQHIKPGATLVLSPSADETFKNYNIGFPWIDWLTELPIYDDDPTDGDFAETITAYSVKKFDK